MPQYKAKYLETLNTHVQIELPIGLYDFIRTIAENNKQPMSDVCIQMLGTSQFHERWFAEYKKGRPYDSRYANRRKKEVKDEAEMTSCDREKLKRLIALCDLLDIDLNTHQLRQI